MCTSQVLSPHSALGYSESPGDALLVLPKCCVCWGLTLFTPVHVESILQLPQTLSTFFPRSCDPSFCPQLLPMSSLNDSPNISRQPAWWKELMLVNCCELVNKAQTQWWCRWTEHTGKFAPGLSPFLTSRPVRGWVRSWCACGKAAASISFQEKQPIHRERPLPAATWKQEAVGSGTFWAFQISAQLPLSTTAFEDWF